jgi:phage terminase large subunit-like protein
MSLQKIQRWRKCCSGLKMSDWNGTAEGWGLGHYREVPICRWVRLCRERQQRDLGRWLQGDPSFPYFYDDKAADKAINFISELVQFEGKFAGQKLSLSDWQEWDIIRPLFGWKRLDNGKRRFTHADIFIPRRMGKSTLAGAVAAALLVADREFGGQVFCAATKEEQAGIVWNAAKKLMEGSPGVRQYIKSFKSSVVCERLGSSLKKLGRDSKTQDGLNVHGAVVDEYHAHKTADMLNVLDSGTGNREQPLIFLISSFGVSGEGTPCQREDQFCRNILEGVIENEKFLCFLATVDDPKKWDQEEEWFKANPNLGITVTLESFRADYERAKQKPDFKVEFLSKKLNIWCSSARSWISMPKYAENDGAVFWERLKGRECSAAFDLGISQDLSAFAMAFMEPNAQIKHDPEGKIILPNIYLKMLFWMPEDNLRKRVEEDRVPYDQWAEQGWMRLTPGSTTRRDIIRKDINELSEVYHIKSIVADQFNAFELMQNLSDDGFKVAKHPQTMVAMNLPCRMFEELVLENRLKHDNDPILRWMVSNAVIVRDGNENIKIVKDRCPDRVDGVVAACMAIGRLMLEPPEPVSVYETQRLVVVG